MRHFLVGLLTVLTLGLVAALFAAPENQVQFSKIVSVQSDYGKSKILKLTAIAKATPTFTVTVFVKGTNTVTPDPAKLTQTPTPTATVTQ